jgi:hypothetical protein
MFKGLDRSSPTLLVAEPNKKTNEKMKIGGRKRAKNEIQKRKIKSQWGLDFFLWADWWMRWRYSSFTHISY